MGKRKKEKRHWESLLVFWLEQWSFPDNRRNFNRLCEHQVGICLEKLDSLQK